MYVLYHSQPSLLLMVIMTGWRNEASLAPSLTPRRHWPLDRITENQTAPQTKGGTSPTLPTLQQPLHAQMSPFLQLQASFTTLLILSITD